MQAYLMSSYAKSRCILHLNIVVVVALEMAIDWAHTKSENGSEQYKLRQSNSKLERPHYSSGISSLRYFAASVHIPLRV